MIARQFRPDWSSQPAAGPANSPSSPPPIPAPVPGPLPLSYKAAFGKTFGLMFCWSVLPFLIVVPLLFGADAVAELGRSVIGTLFVTLFGAAIYVNCFPIWVDDDGIRAFDSWGRERRVAWTAMAKVKPVNVLGFGFLRLTGTSKQRGASRATSTIVWLPQFLAEGAAFEAAVLLYGDPRSPLWHHCRRTHPITAPLHPSTRTNPTPVTRPREEHGTNPQEAI